MSIRKHGLVVRAVLATLLAGSLALMATVEGAFATTTATTVTPTSSDYLTAASADPECGKAVSQRGGNWVCPNTTNTSAAQVKKDAQKALGSTAVSPANTPAVAASSGYCTITGCWYPIGQSQAEFSGTGTYGYGSTALGSMQLYFVVTATGANVKTYPLYISTSRASKNQILSIEDLYLSNAYPSGNNENPRHYAQKSFSTVTAGGVSRQYPSPGASWYETVAWVTVAGEGTWQDTSSAYPGTWYSWAKSIKLQRQSSGGYYVQGATVLPTAPTGSGWRP